MYHSYLSLYLSIHLSVYISLVISLYTTSAPFTWVRATRVQLEICPHLGDESRLKLSPLCVYYLQYGRGIPHNILEYIANSKMQLKETLQSIQSTQVAPLRAPQWICRQTKLQNHTVTWISQTMHRPSAGKAMLFQIGLPVARKPPSVFAPHFVFNFV